jgi:putative ABC transport system permease protein
MSARRIATWRRYLRFWGVDHARDLDDELRFHLEARYDEYVAGGMDPAAARAEVERRFGDVGVVRDKCTAIDSQWQRERTMVDRFHVIVADLRFALRQLQRSPSLSIAAILCFALGIGANTSIFSVVDAILFRPLPFPDGNRLVLIGEGLPRFGGNNFGLISTPEYHDYQRLEGSVFEKTAIYETTSLTLASGGGDPERVPSAVVSATLFDVLRVKAARGRTFAAGEDRVGGPNVAVISDAHWRRRFNGDSLIVGRSVVINGVPTTIIGVMPPSFAFPLSGMGGGVAEVFSPYWITADVEKQRGDMYNTSLIARLAPGVTLERAKIGASDIAKRLPQLHPDAYGSNHVTIADVFPLRERATGPVRDSLLVLLAAVGLVLLIACINVSSLLLARTAARQREISVRRALGASRGRLAQQFLAETLVLVTVGGGLGVLFAVWGSKTLAQYAPPALLQGYDISVDARVLAVTALITVATAIVISLLPTLQQPEHRLATALRDEGRAASGGVSRQRGRRTLVVSEIALALIVATGAGLMVKSLLNAHDVDPGFDPSGVASFRLGLIDSRYPTPEKVVQFERALIERLRAVPGVRDATIATAVPMSGLWRLTFSLEGRNLPTIPTGINTLVFPRYFETMRIPVRVGRAFENTDVVGSPSVVIVNEALARQFFPGVNPVGRRLKWGSPESPREWSTIVGVAGDVHVTALESPVEPAVYFPALQADTFLVHRALRGMSYIVRADGDPRALFNDVRRIVKDADPELPIVGLRAMNEIMDLSFAGRRFNTTLLGAFALLAVALAAVGIYGLMAYTVVQRTREIGIRLAIGAAPFDVLRLIVGQATRVAGVGVVLGLIGAFALTRIMEKLLFGVSPLDPATFVGAALLLFGIAGVASYLPARRAARIDPQSAIRAD